MPRVAANLLKSNRQQEKLMKRLNRMFMVMAGVAWMAGLGANNVLAQQDRPQRGNFDPAEMQQRRMDNLKEQLEVKDDTEWNAIKPLITKVMDAQRAAMADRMRGAFRGFGRGGGQGGGGGGGAGFAAGAGGGGTAGDQGNGGGRRFRGGFGGEPSPEADALEKAVEAKASNSEMKAALAKYQEARKAKEAELAKAQNDLRKVLSVRQEAIATVNGLL